MRRFFLKSNVYTYESHMPWLYTSTFSSLIFNFIKKDMMKLTFFGWSGFNPSSSLSFRTLSSFSENNQIKEKLDITNVKER